jgi:hypothetical protein
MSVTCADGWRAERDRREEIMWQVTQADWLKRVRDSRLPNVGRLLWALWPFLPTIGPDKRGP